MDISGFQEEHNNFQGFAQDIPISRRNCPPGMKIFLMKNFLLRLSSQGSKWVRKSDARTFRPTVEVYAHDTWCGGVRVNGSKCALEELGKSFEEEATVMCAWATQRKNICSYMRGIIKILPMTWWQQLNAKFIETIRSGSYIPTCLQGQGVGATDIFDKRQTSSKIETILLELQGERTGQEKAGMMKPKSSQSN